MTLNNLMFYGKLNGSPFADPNSNYDILESAIVNSINKHIVRKSVKFNKYQHSKSKWITKGIIKSIKYKDNLYKKMKITCPNSLDYHVIKSNLSTYSTILKKSIRNAKKHYFESLFEKYKINMRKTWSTINDILSRKTNNKSIPDHFIDGNEIIIDKQTIANHLNSYFTNIGPNVACNKTNTNDSDFSHYINEKIDINFAFSNVNEGEIIKIINNLPSKSSSGKDQISTNLSKQIKHCITPSLTLIINQMLNTGIFPDNLKITKVIPLFKKDDDKSFSNYRPISILFSISKVFEKVIYNQSYCHFDSHNLFYISQYGFRKGFSTELASLELIDRIMIDLDNGKLPYCVFLDLSKAFDTIDHKILLAKLNHYGINGSASQVIKSYHSNRKQYVDFDCTTSGNLSIETGVSQGSIFGPLLCNIHINDLSCSTDFLRLYHMPMILL